MGQVVQLSALTAEKVPLAQASQALVPPVEKVPAVHSLQVLAVES